MNSNIILVYGVRIIALLIAIIPHEFAHGLAAYAFGDDTAKRNGRLSFNPINHIDPMGLLFMVLFRVGWAKAVPINVREFKNRRLGLFVVSIAGVFTNFIIGLIAAIVFVKVAYTNEILSMLFREIMWYNVMLGVFNLVPLPPLDGSKILLSFFSEDVQDFILTNEKYIYILLVIGIFSGFITTLISPAIQFVLEKFITIGLMI
ncbi:site-2 protease family protein [Peptoniphilus asaccharolyticus]